MKSAATGSEMPLQMMVFLFLLIGLAVASALEYDHFQHGPIIRGVNFFLYDTYIRKSRNVGVSDRIVIVDIDEKSLKRIGQWPWTRYMLGKVVKRVGDMGPAAIGLDILMPEQDRTSLSSIRDSFKRDFDITLGFTGVPPDLMDSDDYLGRIIGETPTVSSHYFLFDYTTNGESCDMRTIDVQSTAEKLRLYEAPGILCNYSKLNNGKNLSGFINTLGDEDGILRRVPVIMEHMGTIYPNLALATVMQAQNFDTLRIEFDNIGAVIKIGDHIIPVDANGAILLSYPGPARRYTYISAVELLDGKVQEVKLRGKIVFIGSSAAGLYDFHHTLYDPHFPGVETLAVAAGNILENIHLRQPSWSKHFSAVLSLLTVLVVTVLFVLVTKPLQAVMGIGMVLFMLLAGDAAAFYGAQLYLPVGAPLLTTCILFTLFSVIRYGTEQRISFLWYQKLTRSQQLTLETMATVLETRDYETGGHIKRTQNFVRVIAEQLVEDGQHIDILSPQYIQMLYISAPLHDIGKVGVPDSILLKPGPLNYTEFEEMKKHTKYGRDILINSGRRQEGDNFLDLACEIAESHHEKWDGTGYPLGLAGQQIPISGRMMMVADVYDALTSKRCYKPAFSHERAREILLDGRGTFFDPAIIDAFLAREVDILTISKRIQDQPA